MALIGYARVSTAEQNLDWGAMTPSSAMCPRKAFTSMVRCRTSRSRVRCSISIACCSAVLIGTKRMLGRVTASQIASASAASVLPRLT